MDDNDVRLKIDSLYKKIDEGLSELDDSKETKKEVKEEDRIFEILNNIKNGISVGYMDMYKLSVDNLLMRDNTNTTYLEYVCKQKITIPINLQKELAKSKEAIYICAKNNYLTWLFTIDNEDIFFEEVENNKTLLDYIYENKVECYSLVGCFKKRYEIIDYLIKYNNQSFYQLSNEIIKLIFTEENGIYIADKYLNNQRFLESVINKVPINLLLNYCSKK